MRAGIKKCAEIVQNLCGTILAQRLGGACENVSAQVVRIFPTRLELFNNTNLYRQINSQLQTLSGDSLETSQSVPDLVAQCSATPATVAATPPCSVTPFQTQISVRHLPAQGGGEVRHQNF